MKYELPSFWYMGILIPLGCAVSGLLYGEVETDVLGGVLRVGEEQGAVVEVNHAPVVGGADLLEERTVEFLTEGIGDFGVVEVEHPLTVDTNHRRVFGELDALLGAHHVGDDTTHRSVHQRDTAHVGDCGG